MIGFRSFQTHHEECGVRSDQPEGMTFRAFRPEGHQVTEVSLVTYLVV